MQSRNSNNIKLIDISHHQKNIDWKKVAADGVKGVIIKATEGVGYVDDMFHNHVAGARSVGLEMGFYHYARPDTNPALRDAQNFLGAVKGIHSTLPHILDFEEDKAKPLGREKLTAWAVTWLKEVARQSNHPVMFYTYTYYAIDYCGKDLAQFPLWIAHYGVDRPGNNGIWDKWECFQYTSTGKVAGIAGNVDVNEMEVNYWMELTQELPFKDVPEKHWAFSLIKQAKEQGIVSGYPDGTFQPDKPITRAEAVALVMAAKK